MTIARLALPCALVLVAGAGCFDGGNEPAARGSDGSPAPVTVAGVRLYPIPDAVAKACRATQRRAEIPVLCPTRLPRPVRDFAGSTALPPDVLTAFPWRANGLDFSYSAESGRPRLDSPDRFLHLQVVRADDPLPPGTRPASLGGRVGLLARGGGRDYSSENYFANHWRFFWHEHDVHHAATLHDFGPRTERLLDRLIRDLRPARSLPARGPAPGVQTIDVPVPGPVSIAVARGQVWVAGQGNRVVSASWLARMDARTGSVLGERVRIARGGGASAVLAQGGSVWVGHRGIPGSIGLQRFVGDPPESSEPFRVRAEIVGLARVSGSLWLVDFGGWPATRHTGAVIEPERRRRIRVGRAPAAIAAGAGRLWVTNNLDDTLTRIDPRVGRVEDTIPVGDGPVGVAVGHGAVWVANTEADTLSRIDPATGDITATVAVGRAPRGVAVARRGVWVTNSLDDTVSEIDPRTNRVVATVPVGAGPTAIAVGAGRVWVANNHDGTVSAVRLRDPS